MRRDQGRKKGALRALLPFPPVTSDPSGESVAEVEIAEQLAMPSRLPGKTAHASFLVFSCILASCGFLSVCGGAVCVSNLRRREEK